MTAIVTHKALVVPRRSGPKHWLRSFRHMTMWNVVRLRLSLPVIVIVQMFTGAGLVLGFSLLYEDISNTQVLYLGTGAVVISLVTVGMVMGPQMIAEQRLTGSYDWFSSLPVPRSASAAAWTMLTVIVAVPGAIAALLAVWLRFDADLHISLLAVPSVVLVLLAGTLIGYAYAHVLPNPRTISLVSQVVIFVVFGFSPIAYPSSNLPGWLASLHTYLPFEPMGDVLRAGVTVGLVDNVTLSFGVLMVWTVIGGLAATWAIGRRP